MKSPRMPEVRGSRMTTDWQGNCIHDAVPLHAVPLHAVSLHAVPLHAVPLGRVTLFLQRVRMEIP